MPDQPARRIAVVAVHGVADQQPGETAEAIANLLSSRDEDGAPAYGPFRADSIRVPVRKLALPKESFRGRAFAHVARDCRKDLTQGKGLPTNDAGLAFMSSLLADYETSGPEETYETTVLRGTRRLQGTTRTVDVFEMYWADLSRLSQSWIKIFAELYQLMFHLGSLGVHAVRAAQASETAAIPEQLQKRWESWSVSQRWAANVLAHPILVFNLFLAALLPVLLATIPEHIVAVHIVWGVFAITAGVTTAYAAYRWYAKHTSAFTAIAAMVIGWAALAFALRYAGWPGRPAPVLASILIVAAAAIGTVTIKAYDAFRPGAWRWARWAGALTIGYLAWNLWIDRDEPHVVLHAVVHNAELIYALLRIFWIAFLGLAWWSVVRGWLLLRAVPKEDAAARDRIKRVKWTARLTLALPAVLFLLTTTVLWGALWPELVRWAPFGGTEHQPRAITLLVVPDLETTLNRLAADRQENVKVGTVDHLVRGFIATASGVGFAAMLATLIIGLGIGLYAVAPSVLSEIRPPAIGRDGTSNGRWLDGGLKLLRWAGRLIFVGVLIILPLGSVLLEWWPDLFAVNGRVLAWSVAALGVAGGGLVVLRNRLKTLMGGIRGVVDTALDVDNYLREHPRASNPRGRIAARMSSLLKHVYRERYDAIVIIAHSQGTVISADLLRFIHMSGLGKSDEDLKARKGAPIYFFTMGSPLRQLYGLRFPHLYQWARHQQAGWPARTHPIPPDVGPNPAELDVAQWVNAYRSGDYVGRYLWRPDHCEFAYEPELTSETAPPVSRREFCIGSGAHQHYWDRSAPAIAIELDRLITR